MKAVLTCRLSSGDTIDVYHYTFSMINFKGAEIVSGDKYYTDKAVKLGATQADKPKVKKSKGA